MELRPYQVEFKNKIYQAFRAGHQNVLGQLATGAGKTIIFSSIIKDGFDSGRRCLVLAHRGELILQAADKLYKGYGVRSGIIKAGYEPRPFEPVQIASVQTLVNRKLVKAPNIVIIDEAHHSQKGNTYGKIKQMILDMNPDCRFLGVTATPCRTNGAGFKDIYNVLIQGVSIPDLIKQGHLTPPRYFVAPLELGNVKISAGDYNLKELSDAFQRKVHGEDLVQNWLKLAKGLKTIGFAIDIEHSKSIVEAFRKHGIPAAHIDGTMPDELRNATIRAFEQGKVTVLYNVGVFDEGFDVPAIEAVQLARPTKSLIKYMQMVGRALRPAPGKDFAIVLDHSGLVGEHDIIEREREWTLEGVEKKETGKELMMKDKRTDKLYKPEQLPLDIPMDMVELVELTVKSHNQVRWDAYMKEFVNLKLLASYRKNKQTGQEYKPTWIWYQMIRNLGIHRIKTRQKAKDKLMDLSQFFCQQYGYANGYANSLVESYLNKNSKQFTR